MKKLLSAALALCMVCSLGVVSMAATVSSVTFNASSNVFTLSDTDLFPDLKGLMPGDTVTQEITLDITNVSNETVNIYLSSTSENEDCATLAEYATLTVSSADGTELASDTLASGVKLAGVTAAYSTTLTVAVEIPIETGNEIAGLTAQNEWVFTAEVIANQTTVTVTTTDDEVVEEETIVDAIVAALTDLVTPDEEVEDTTTELDDAEIPMASDEADEPVMGEVEDGDIPLFATSDVGTWALVNLILAIVTVALSVVIATSSFLNKQAEHQDEQEGAANTHKKWLEPLFSLLISAVSVVCFVLTEDMSLPMAMLDKWTLAMLLLTLVQVFVALRVRKTTSGDDDATAAV